jgi:hypothetical protein
MSGKKGQSLHGCDSGRWTFVHPFSGVHAPLTLLSPEKVGVDGSNGGLKSRVDKVGTEGYNDGGLRGHVNDAELE